MKEFRCYVPASNGQVCEMRGRMKEWEDIRKWERDALAQLLARLVVDAYLHPPPMCRFCLRDDCPALKNQADCPAERPIRWLPADAPRTRRRGDRRQKVSRARNTLDQDAFLNRL